MSIDLRPLRAEDLDALYDIALKTGDAGGDATRFHKDRRLLGHLYAAPYGVLAPNWCVVAEDEEGVCGYVVGAPDTRSFADELERSWWPELRGRYPDPGPPPFASADAARIYQMYHPSLPPAAVIDRFPAHMHMNILPRAQGQGVGRALCEKWCAMAEKRGVSGVHVGVSPKNHRGAAFWQACRLSPIEFNATEAHPALWFGRWL